MSDSTELVPVPRPELPAVAGPVDLYGAWLAGLSPATIVAYSKDVAHFSAWLGLARSATVEYLVSRTPGEANGLALSWVAHMRERGLAASTICRRLSALRSLVGMANTIGLIAWTIRVRSPKSEPYRDTSGPGRNGTEKMLNAARRQVREKGPLGRRDLAIFRLFHDLGSRRGAVNNLDLDDVDLAEGKVSVVEKGKTEPRRRTLSRPAVEALRDWIESRGPAPGPLFVRLDRAAPGGPPRRMDSKSIWRITRRLGRIAGVERGTNPHGLRHEAITRALELTNGNIAAVQEFSGHADPRTVMIYNKSRRDEQGRIARMLGEDLV
jgi:integrase/recombinase XerC